MIKEKVKRKRKERRKEWIFHTLPPAHVGRSSQMLHHASPHYPNFGHAHCFKADQASPTRALQLPGFSTLPPLERPRGRPSSNPGPGDGHRGTGDMSHTLRFPQDGANRARIPRSPRLRPDALTHHGCGAQASPRLHNSPPQTQTSRRKSSGNHFRSGGSGSDVT